ncbi:MAG: GYD domain-containing protein [Methanomicrobiales archaeon]|nr:GYD domain-containing protein [Methanomicrobiales archaeon]
MASGDQSVKYPYLPFTFLEIFHALLIVGIYWTLGMYDTVVLFEAPNEKVAMKMALNRADRMDIETLVAVSAEDGSPAGPA